MSTSDHSATNCMESHRFLRPPGNHHSRRTRWRTVQANSTPAAAADGIIITESSDIVQSFLSSACIPAPDHELLGQICLGIRTSPHIGDSPRSGSDTHLQQTVLTIRRRVALLLLQFRGRCRGSLQLSVFMELKSSPRPPQLQSCPIGRENAHGIAHRSQAAPTTFPQLRFRNGKCQRTSHFLPVRILARFGTRHALFFTANFIRACACSAPHDKENHEKRN